MTEDVWRVVVRCPIGTPDRLTPRATSSIPDTELTLRMNQVYPIHVVLLRWHQGATRMLKPCMGGRREQEFEGAELASWRNCVVLKEKSFFADASWVPLVWNQPHTSHTKGINTTTS